MSDTMISMDLIHADNLSADQIMVGDLIKIGDDIVEVVSVDSDTTGDTYDIETQNEFGEKEITQYAYKDVIELYVFIEQEEQKKVFFVCFSAQKCLGNFPSVSM